MIRVMASRYKCSLIRANYFLMSTYIYGLVEENKKENMWTRCALLTGAGMINSTFTGFMATLKTWFPLCFKCV